MYSKFSGLGAHITEKISNIENSITHSLLDTEKQKKQVKFVLYNFIHFYRCKYCFNYVYLHKVIMNLFYY
jgi:hypothetical protein